MGVIFFLSSIPQAFMPEFIAEFKIDKLTHFLEYLILGALLVRAFLHSDLEIELGGSVLIAVGVALVFAALDEGYQYFVPGRTADLADWLCDSLGSASGIVLYFIGALSSE